MNLLPGLNIVKIQSKLGYVFNFEELKQAIEQYKPVVLFIVHAEPGTGIVQPLDGLGDICHRLVAFINIYLLLTHMVL